MGLMGHIGPIRPMRQPDKNNLPDVLRLDNDAPFGERVGTLQALFKGPKGFLRQTHTAFVGLLQESNDRRNAIQVHGFGPLQYRVSRVQKRSIPMPFENAPASLDGIVFAVIRGVIGSTMQSLD